MGMVTTHSKDGLMMFWIHIPCLGEVLYVRKNIIWSISTDFTSTPSDASGSSTSYKLSQHFSQEKDLSIIQPELPFATLRGQLKQSLRKNLQSQPDREQDSGLFKGQKTKPRHV